MKNTLENWTSSTETLENGTNSIETLEQDTSIETLDQHTSIKNVIQHIRNKQKDLIIWKTKLTEQDKLQNKILNEMEKKLQQQLILMKLKWQFIKWLTEPLWNKKAV